MILKKRVVDEGVEEAFWLGKRGEDKSRKKKRAFHLQELNLLLL